MSSKEINVLLVEDNTDHQLLAEMAIKRLGQNIKLTSCDDGDEALELVDNQNFTPDIILMDIELMCGENGFEVAKTLKTRPQLKNAEVIYYTGYDNPEYEALAKETGAFDYIMKHTDMSVTVTQLKKVIERWRKGFESETVTDNS